MQILEQHIIPKTNFFWQSDKNISPENDAQLKNILQSIDDI
jgi:hypothetical protein